jgi:hippurate hydrolase
MTAWLGTARRLAAIKNQWSGTLVMILQPGEETGEGAKAMLADGLFTRFPKPDHVLAFHDAAAMPAGVIGVTPGYALANVDSVDMIVRGVGGHGAYPQTTKDPIVLASRIVTTLQTLVSRENDPANPAVVTVGSFQAGAKHNIISDEANLQLTVRSYTPEVRKLLLDGIRRIARGEAIAAGLPEDRMPVVTIREAEFTPATFNTDEFSNQALALFTRLIFWVGGTPKAEYDAAGGNAGKLPSLHSPFWAPEAETVISTAIEALSLTALDVLKKT